MSTAHLRKLDLNLMLVLDVLLRERSVTRAAEQLGLTQSATSRALGRLREQFDDTLLVRTQQGMVPTPRAAALADTLARILDELTAVTQNEHCFEPSTVDRSFRIATVDYCVAVLLPDLLQQVEKVAPNVRVEVTAPGERLDEQLESGEIDLFIGPRRRSFHAVVWKRLFTDEFVTMVRRDHPNVGRSLSLARFAELGHVVVAPERRVSQSAIDRELGKLGLSRRVTLRVPSFLVAPLVVGQSELISTAPARLATRFEAALPIRLLKTPLALGALTMSMAWHERVRNDVGHQWFRNSVSAAMK